MSIPSPSVGRRFVTFTSDGLGMMDAPLTKYLYRHVFVTLGLEPEWVARVQFERQTAQIPWRPRPFPEWTLVDSWRLRDPLPSHTDHVVIRHATLKRYGRRTTGSDC